MTTEYKSQSISMKVSGQAEIKLTAPGSAIKLTTDCTTWPGGLEKWLAVQELT